MTQAMYAVHNTARGRHNRHHRAAAATHRGMKQHIGDGQHRLIRGRPVFLTEEMFQKYLPDLQARAAAHLLEVRTMDGRKVDLSTLEVQAAPALPPMPHFPPNSIANDEKRLGKEVIPPYVGDDQHSLPNVLPPGQLPEVLQKLADDEAAAQQVETELSEMGEDETTDGPDDETATSPEDAVSSGGKGSVP